MSAMKRRALVVDDDDGVRFVLREALSRGGWMVTEVNDGAQVEERVAQERYDLILLDLFMPGMNGYEVLRRLRHRQLLRQARGPCPDRADPRPRGRAQEPSQPASLRDSLDTSLGCFLHHESGCLLHGDWQPDDGVRRSSK